MRSAGGVLGLLARLLAGYIDMRSLSFAFHPIGVFSERTALAIRAKH
jgi:hypothetical protein